MFGFFERKSAPGLIPGKPGVGCDGKVAFANGERSWTENINMVSLMAAVLKRHGYSATSRSTWLTLNDSGLTLQPQIAEIQPLDDGGVRTVSTIQSSHFSLAPLGVFEYQHSTGSDVADSMSKGIDQWVQSDLVALLEALRPKPEFCTTLEMEFPEKTDQPARARRAVLGPVMHFMQDPPKQADAVNEDHPFCPCCLLTHSFEAFRELFEQDKFYGLRLFALRDAEGTAQADCRVNGEDWEKGAQALREYAQTWPPAGYEFRKQYVVLHTMKSRSR